MTNEPHAQTLAEQEAALLYATALCRVRLDVEAPFNREIIKGYVDTLEAMSAALRAPQGWQPIATAPKPGVPILVWVPRKMSIYAVIHDDDGGFFRVLHPSGPVLAECPTHWQPLPLPPVSPATEQE